MEGKVKASGGNKRERRLTVATWNTDPPTQFEQLVCLVRVRYALTLFESPGEVKEVREAGLG